MFKKTENFRHHHPFISMVFNTVSMDEDRNLKLLSFVDFSFFLLNFFSFSVSIRSLKVMGMRGHVGEIRLKRALSTNYLLLYTNLRESIISADYSKHEMGELLRNINLSYSLRSTNNKVFFFE